MEILAIINKVLDLKIVQWSLLALCALMIIGNTWFTIKYNALRLDNALLKNTVADVSNALHIQNREIQKLGEQTKIIQANYEQKNREAAKIALEGQKTLQALMAQQFVGTCDEKVGQALELVKRSTAK